VFEETIKNNEKEIENIKYNCDEIIANKDIKIDELNNILLKNKEENILELKIQNDEN
jgi:hypothetical protein